jgi:hypothetical protein
MKKILFLGLVLALLAVVAVPVAAFADTTGDTEVSGTFVAASLSVTAPDPLNFGNFVQGYNYAGPSVGNVTFDPGSSAETGWSMTALGNSTMFAPGPIYLNNYLLISADDSTWFIANGGSGSVNGIPYSGTLTYTGGSGTNLPFNFWAAQFIVPADQPGVYSDTITFTASMTP